MQYKSRPTFAPLALMNVDRPSEAQWLLDLFREAFLETRLGRLIAPRPPPPDPQYLPAEEIISRSVRHHGQAIPPDFLEIFLELPVTGWERVYQNLGADDIRRIRMAAQRFDNFIGENNRQNYPRLALNQAKVLLIGTERVKVLRNYSTIEISHEQLDRSLRTIISTTMYIRQEGKLEARSFHVPRLKCDILRMQVMDPIRSEEEDELAQIFEQINANNEISSTVTLMVRKENNRELLRQRLETIASRNTKIPIEGYSICILPL